MKRLCLVMLILAFGLATGMAQAQMWDPRALAIDPATATEPVAPVLQGLGDLHHRVSTANPRSQMFFDQGLRLAYAFNHSEALRAFKEAARLDPDNAMAYWGWAFVFGPNINLPMQPEVAAQAYAAISKAVARKDKASPAERDYIDALAVRYAANPPGDRTGLDRAYAEAMGRLAARYPDDLDAATLYADALMNLSPWNYWHPDGSPRENTSTVIATLESVLKRAPNHAGAIHLYIHVQELPHPELAVAGADRLLDLMPGGGHQVHMPSHIYMRVGRYADAYRTNERATAADELYLAQCQAQGIYPLLYYNHNMHFLVWAALFQGRSEAALAAARKLAVHTGTDFAHGLPFLDEHFLSQAMYALIRFGRWQEMLKEPQPPADAPFMTAIWHYGRGLAYRFNGRRSDADRELAALRRIGADKGIAGRAIGFASMPLLLEIAQEVLAGEIAVSHKDYGGGIARLDRAVRLQDGLLYDEPPDWFFPVRHYLGAALLDAGRAAEAEVVYWQDLTRNPENGYALHGLQAALQRQNKTADAADAEKRFRTAWKDADVTLSSSRF